MEEVSVLLLFIEVPSLVDLLLLVQLLFASGLFDDPGGGLGLGLGGQTCPFVSPPPFLIVV